MNIAFIPARGGSKSIPLKNIKEINGRPLIYWVLHAAGGAKCIDKIVVATDSNKIAETVLSFNCSKLELYMRDAENAQDTSATESVMLEYLKKTDYKPDDKFFLIQATSPMLKAEHIDKMYEKLISEGADSIFSGVVEKQFKWFKEPVKPVNYDYRNRPRRQDFVGLVAETGACYINTVGNIIREKCRISGNITFCELPRYTAYEIDEPEDWIIVEQLMRHFGY